MEDNNAFSQEQEQIKQMFDYWSEVVRLPTVGPFQAFSKDFTFYIQEFFNLGQTLIQLQTNLKEYWIQINDAYLEAMNEVAKRVSNNPYNSKKDFEIYRRIVIDVFEEAFTGLFNSKEFGVINSKMTSSQLDAAKHLQNIIEKNFKTLNLPTRSEVDEMSKDIHDLKRMVHDMKKKLKVELH